MPLVPGPDLNTPVIRLVVVGGFLGSGKTTAILGIARRLAAQGLTLGIVTNDQGSNLVDTEVLRQNGLHVMEIAGGCFCCNFEQFSEKLEQMSRERAPDIILAEPVGSCTDLVATVMKPLGVRRPDVRRPGVSLSGSAQLALAPLSVVVDPRRLRLVIREQATGAGDSPGFSDEINYLFMKQLEEAEVIALNKCDLIPEGEAAGMESWLRQRFPGVTVFRVSAARGDGMEEWTALVGQGRRFSERPSMQVAYDTYAAAEAELGWLNVRAEIRIVAGDAIVQDGNALLASLMERIRSGVMAAGHEIAHLKSYLVSGSDWVKMSCTGTGHPLSVDHKMTIPLDTASLVLNLRAAQDPDALRSLVIQAIDETFAGFAEVRDVVIEAFRPSYPRPVIRME